MQRVQPGAGVKEMSLPPPVRQSCQVCGGPSQWLLVLSTRPGTWRYDGATEQDHVCEPCLDWYHLTLCELGHA